MFLPNPNEGGSYTPVPPGTYLAVCIRVIDLGTQKTTWQGQPKEAHKVLLTWELIDDDLKTQEGKPLTISSRYTWSMADKANLRKHLEAWRGRPFEQQDFGEGGFNIRNILGTGCLLTITQTEKDGKTYDNVAGIGKLMKGQKAPQPVNPLTYLWIHESVWDPAAFDSLSENLQNLIKATPQYEELRKAQRGEGGLPDARDTQGDFIDDDIPF